ncbi:DUF6891 domain-containing protein [Actinosynnema sp. NPDC053489]|uniref:DUF6891 domain-containing protein n=1 Tax=Actinosynnema sp. NPDC053489 TaxID=3363916 RepID=UPI0037CB1E41
MVERAEDGSDLPAEVAAEVEEHARAVVHGGFTALDDAVRDVAEHFEDEPAVTPRAVRRVVERVWRERAAEQAGWPATTDVDRLLAAFAALDRGGIVARADFTCCQTCGHAEIGAEAAGPARGYVFFHRQDTEGAVARGRLWLAFGSFAGSAGPGAADPAAADPAPADLAAADEAVGREVVAALAAGGLPVEWNGSVRTRIEVGPITWRKRLPVG